MKKKRYETKTVYAVWSNTDLNDGSGRAFIQYYCDLEATALRVAKRNYVQAANSPVEPVELIRINNDWYYPNHITISPSDLDIKEEKKIAEQREIKSKKEAVLEKARQLGFSDEEIATLSS